MIICQSWEVKLVYMSELSWGVKNDIILKCQVGKLDGCM